MSLYLKEPNFPDFEEAVRKLGLKIADLRLPYDAGKWDDEIIDALHEQHPYLPQGQVKLSMNVKDTKNGYAVGNITIDDKIQLPIIVDNFHLQPFELFMKNGELHALTKESILGALQHTEFGETVTPGQGESSDVFMTHSRPPFDGKYTFAAWTEGDPQKIEEALTNVFDPDGAEYFLGGDDRLKKILDATMSGTKKYQHMRHQGSVHEPNVTPLIRNTKAPTTEKKAARIVRPPEGEISSSGGSVEVLDGNRKVAGFIFDSVYDFDLGARPYTRFVPNSGAGYQDGPVFVTERKKEAAEIAALPEASPNSGESGMWIWPQDGKLCCTEVVQVLDKTASVFRVKNASRMEHTVARHPLMGVVVKDKGVTYLPKQATFVRCDNNKLSFGPATHEPESFIALSERGGRYKAAFYVSREARQKLGRTLYDDMSEPKAFNLLERFFEDDSARTALLAAKRSGTSVKIAFDNVDLSSTVDPKKWDSAVDKAVKTAKKYAPTILAAALKVRAVNGDSLRKMASMCQSKDSKAALWLKKAVEYDEEDDAQNVDQALDLNIVTPQNVQKYVEGIDLLDRARQFMLKLLLASRLGLEIDANAARTAAFSLDEVIRDLQQLRSLSTAGVEG